MVDSSGRSERNVLRWTLGYFLVLSPSQWLNGLIDITRSIGSSLDLGQAITSHSSIDIAGSVAQLIALLISLV